MIKTVLVTIHGQQSVGEKMAELSYELSGEGFVINCQFINIRYTKLPMIINTLPWVRTMTAKYIASRLETINLKYPEAKIIVIAHSNGTRATRIAMDMRFKPKKKWPGFQIDDLILLGCPIKRGYKWTRHPHTNVVNFISINDLVVWAARFYGMGSAGRFGFKHPAPNLKQFFVKWGHSGFMDHYLTIAGYLKLIMTKTEGDIL